MKKEKAEEVLNAGKKEDSYKSYCKNEKEVLEHFDVDPETGLSEEEAGKRLAKYGQNKLQEARKAPFIVKFLRQFTEPLVIVLLLAAIISLVIFFVNKGLGKPSDEWIDAIVILAIVIINALIGAIQEQKAEQSLEALKKLSTPMCTVKRGGKLASIKSEDVVPGDIVVLEEGDIVPADIRLLTSVDMKSDESSLTGESVPSEKDSRKVLSEDALTADRVNIVHMSCPISYGRGLGVVVSTGMDTEVGKIATMLTAPEDDETPLQKKLAVLSKQLGLLCLIIVIATFLIGMIWAIVTIATSPEKDWSLLGGETLNLFEEAVALAVAAIPEGLSAIVTIALALGVGKMVKVHTIVRKLPSVETLGSVTVVCSDKTGTLTQNRMTIKKVYINGRILDASKIKREEVSFLATGMMLCSNASINGARYGDPTEIALLDYAKKYGIDKEKTEKESQPRIDELPFDSVRKMMSVENEYHGRKIVYTKGALDSILKHTNLIEVNGEVRPITPSDIDAINKAATELGSQAFRVLAFAYHYYEEKGRIQEENLVYVGMVGMIDPERPEAKPAVSKLKEAGIRTVMITGDHKDTAFAIASNLGIAKTPTECISGDEINALSEEQLREKVKTTNVYARVSPENKVQIVRALKANGNIVSMTGDGVNDAPSLRAADIGIAMGITGTDVAKSAADMVLTDDNFASIEKAVEEGRGIFANVKKSIIYLLSSNFAEVLVMFFVLMLGMPTPLETLQILWINLITDSLPAIALSMNPKEKDIMKQKPRNPKDGIFSHGAFGFTLSYGVLIFVTTLAAYLIPAIAAYTGAGAGVSYFPQVSSAFGSGYQGFISCLKNPEVHLECTTWAFTVLGMSEIFHMIGMTDIKRSFVHVFKEKNWMLLVSFVLGFTLQILVTEVPGLCTIFRCQHLDWQEWLILAALATAPLILHEILAPVLRKKNSQII